jgi:hypothetical protein
MRPDMANTTDQHESAPQSFVCGVPDVEDDLRILRGTLKALSMISVRQDEIHPEGLHVLARFGEEALDRVYDKWAAARKGRSIVGASAD